MRDNVLMKRKFGMNTVELQYLPKHLGFLAPLLLYGYNEKILIKGVYILKIIG